MDNIIGFGVPLALLFVGLTAGKITEANHFARLKRREEKARGVIVSNVKSYVLDRQVQYAKLISSNVVISTDYFKSICASLRRLVGGRIISYEKLVERGRREALLRLKDEAAALGADFVLNVRFETMTVARSSQGKGVTGIEVLAYGTAVKAVD